MKEIAIITTNEAGNNFFVESSVPLTKEQQDALVEFTTFYKGNIAITFENTDPLTVTDMTLLVTGTCIDVAENFYNTMYNPGVSKNIQIQ